MLLVSLFVLTSCSRYIVICLDEFSGRDMNWLMQLVTYQSVQVRRNQRGVVGWCKGRGTERHAVFL